MTTMTFPPENFAQLRQTALMIRHGELEFPIGRKTRNALFAMIDSPELVAVSNIVELSRTLEISPASLTRLAKLFGFSGFNPFQKLFRHVNRPPVHYYSDNLRGMLADENVDVTTFMHRQAAMLQQSIRSFLTRLDPSTVQKAVSLLIQQKRVFVFGYRQSSSSAALFRYGLTLLRDDVHLLMQADHGVAVAMNQITADDLIILIGSSPHSEVTLKIAAMTQELNSKLLVITDDDNSPLTEAASVHFVIPGQGKLYVNSQALNCFVIESLLSQTALQMGHTALEKLQNYEILLSKFQINS